MNEAYENLANAIVIQAVKDYRKALERMKNFSYSRTAVYIKREVEKFFRSDWYKTLTSVDAEFLIKKLNREVLS